MTTTTKSLSSIVLVHDLSHHCVPDSSVCCQCCSKFKWCKQHHKCKPLSQPYKFILHHQQSEMAAHHTIFPACAWPRLCCKCIEILCAWKKNKGKRKRATTTRGEEATTIEQTQNDTAIETENTNRKTLLKESLITISHVFAPFTWGTSEQINARHHEQFEKVH